VRDSERDVKEVEICWDASWDKRKEGYRVNARVDKSESRVDERDARDLGREDKDGRDCERREER